MLNNWLENEPKETLVCAVTSVIALVLSITGVLRNVLPFDIAWIAIILCGIPILVGAFKGGDIISVIAGETVPVDGTILEGETSIDQSVMTGESIPADKVPGDTVFSGTINQFGTFTMRADAVSENSSLQRMVRLTEEAEENKAPIVTAADRWATWLVVIALSCAVITWIVTGQFMRAVTVLVVFCPCAFILATPTAVLAGIGNGWYWLRYRRGISRCGSCQRRH